MDRTVILHNTTNQNHKKLAECEKLSEHFLCNEIHDNLRTLALIHPFSDELREVFEKGMFIKPNAKAFPHVMKYLLMICDATEFKKRFCWPIYNKAAEATFRNSTIELLNKLNARYSLGFGEVKNKILIFPGGMEFMRVIYELTRLSMQLILKRHGVTDPENQPPVTLSGAKKLLDDLEDVCNYVMDYKKKVQDYSAQMKAKTEVMYKLLKKVTANTNITPENVLNDEFTDGWERVQSDTFARAIEPDVERLMKFQDDCQKIEEGISAIFKKQNITFDMNALASFTTEMQKMYPQHYQQMAAIVENGRINLGNLLQTFQLALPSMIQSIECYRPRNIEAMSYESNQLQKVSKRTNDLLHRILELCEPVDVDEVKEVVEFNAAPAFEHIQSMILTTPTISHDAIRRAQSAAIQSKRLSLLEDAYQMRPELSTYCVAAKPLNSVLEESRANDSQKVFLSPNRLFAKDPKSKLDPMAMLYSITKKSKQEKNACGGTVKPPKALNGLRFGIGNNQLECSRINDTTLSTPDFSSTLLNQSNDIKDNQISVNEQINTSLSKSFGDRKVRSLLMADFDSPDCDINSSPSGRIEPLVTSKIYSSDVQTKDSDKEQTNLCVTPIQRKMFNSNVSGRNLARDLSNIENNQNAPNKSAFNLNGLINADDESLLNISDRILNDLNLDDSNLS